MRAEADRERIRRLMQAFGRAASGSVRVYIVGATTAVLLGWPALKESLQVNLEMASPVDFIPVPPRWEERSTFVERVGRVAFCHFDLYAQALAKVERGTATTWRMSARCSRGS